MNRWQCKEPAGLHPLLPKDQLIHLERGWAANEDSNQQLPLPADSHTQLTGRQGARRKASSSQQQTFGSPRSRRTLRGREISLPVIDRAGGEEEEGQVTLGCR